MTKDRDTFVGLFLIVFATIVFIMTTQFPEALSGELGPGFFPQLCALAVGLCGVGLTVQGWKRKEKMKMPSFAWNKLIIMALILAAYSIALRIVGFRISTILFVLTCMIFMGERKPITLASIPFAISFGVYYLFVKVFLIVLP